MSGAYLSTGCALDCAHSRPAGRRATYNAPTPPAGWRVCRGDMIGLSAMSITHAADDMEVAPGLALDSGYMRLLVIPGDTPRCDLIGALLQMENGMHIKYKHLAMIDVRAFCLVPGPEVSTGRHGNVQIDGECCEYANIQAEVHRGMASMYCPPPTAPTAH